MRKIDADDLVDFMKTRQIHQIRNLIQAKNVWPKIAIFGDIDDIFMKNLREYLNDFYDVAKKSELVLMENFANDDNENFAKINEKDDFQGILINKQKAEISRIKDIGGVLKNSDFDTPEELAKKYFVAGFNLEEDFFGRPESLEFTEIKNFVNLEIAALVDNLIRTCQINFAK